jgi:hypothetical protein
MVQLETRTCQRSRQGWWWCRCNGPAARCKVGSFDTMIIACLVNSMSMLAIRPVSTSLPPLFVFTLINGCANGSISVGLRTAVAMVAPCSAAAASIALMVFFWAPRYLLGEPPAALLIEATGAADAVSVGTYRAAFSTPLERVS